MCALFSPLRTSSPSENNVDWWSCFFFFDPTLPEVSFEALLLLLDILRNDGCRRRSGPQTSNQSKSTSLNRYMGWILSFWPSSEDKNLPQGVTLQVGLMQLPLPEKFDMIWCTWINGCRRQSGPQTSYQSESASLDEYMGWTLSFWLSSEGKNLPQGITL